MSTLLDFSPYLANFSKLIEYPLFYIKQSPVTMLSLIMFFVVICIFFIISKTLCRLMLVKALHHLHLQRGTEFTLVRVTHYIIMFIGALVAFQFVGIDLSGLVVIFGMLSVGIGFGLQNLTSNFISGLILLFERPISVGDRVTVGEYEGDVMEINMRSTEIRSLNNISIIVPNSDFVSTKVINWSHSGDMKIRLQIEVGVSYNSDIDLVIKCLKEVAKENPDVLETPPPEIYHRGFGDSAWNMMLGVWISNPKRHNGIRSDINCAIIRKFRANDIEIPFPQRDLHIRSSIPISTRAEPAD